MENISEAEGHRNLSVKIKMEISRPSDSLAWAYGALLCLILKSVGFCLNWAIFSKIFSIPIKKDHLNCLINSPVKW